MSTAHTNISWADRTWSPTRGCSRVSAGCTNCYAETIAARFSGPGMPYEGLAGRVNGHPAWTGKVALIEKALEEPLHWRKPARIFVDSMSDLFHKDVPDSYLDSVWSVMKGCPQHTFQILTKRPERMRDYMLDRGRCAAPTLPNVWLGTSVENQETADDRIPYLMQTPAAVRFLSCEPMLGPIDLATLNDGIGWVIAGGESGSGARPMHTDWVRSLRDQCKTYEVPFHYKQTGAWREASEYADGTHLLRVDGTFVTRASATANQHDLVDRGHTGWVRMRKVPALAHTAPKLDGVLHQAFPENVR